MDPNEALARIRSIIGAAGLENPRMTPLQQAHLVEFIDSLDDWMTCGGFLPDAWSNKDEGWYS